MKNDIIFICPHCESRNHYYEKFDKNQLKLEYKTKICKFCNKQFELNRRNFSYEVINIDMRGDKNKMKRIKQDVAGKFLTPEDVGNKGDKATFTILSEGVLTDGQYGERLVITVNSTSGVEKNMTLSPTNENTLIAKFGGETTLWIDKEFDILVESCSVSKSGLQLTILE